MGGRAGGRGADRVAGGAVKASARWCCTGHFTSTPRARAAWSGQFGSRISSRARRTASALPEATISLAWAGSVIMPTAPVAIWASARNSLRERDLVAGGEKLRASLPSLPPFPQPLPPDFGGKGSQTAVRPLLDPLSSITSLPPEMGGRAGEGGRTVAGGAVSHFARSCCTGHFTSTPRARAASERPVRIAHQLAGEEDGVGAAGGDDFVGLGGLGDHADGAGGDPGFGADRVRERDLVAGGDRDLRVGDEAAGGAVDEVDARSRGRGRGGCSAGDPSRRRPSRWRRGGRRGELLGPGGADGGDHVEEELRAVGRSRRPRRRRGRSRGGEELVDQVAVGGVELDDLEAGGAGAGGGGDELRDDLGDVRRRRAGRCG